MHDSPHLCTCQEAAEEEEAAQEEGDPQLPSHTGKSIPPRKITKAHTELLKQARAAQKKGRMYNG